jgi:hypothetical protein
MDFIWQCNPKRPTYTIYLWDLALVARLRRFRLLSLSLLDLR